MQRYDVNTPQYPTTMGNATLFIISTLVCCFITIFSVLAVVVLRPENKDAVTTIIAVMSPITMALLTAGIYGVQKGVNGRFSQLLNATAVQASTAGRAEVIRQLYYQLSQLDPDSPEFREMAKTARTEAIRHFEAVERRGTGATEHTATAGPGVPPPITVPTPGKEPPL